MSKTTDELRQLALAHLAEVVEGRTGCTPSERMKAAIELARLAEHREVVGAPAINRMAHPPVIKGR